MNGLGELIRLHKWRLEAQRRKLAELEALAQSFLDQIAALDARTQEEGRLVQGTPEVAPTLGGYVQASLHRRAKLQSSRADVEREIVAVRENVTAAFRELKRYELSEARRRERLRLALRRRARIVEDDIGVDMFRRRRAAGE